MSLAEELLENSVSIYTVDPETEPHIVIGADRFITVPEELKRIAVQFDHDVETVTIDCPRYWDDIDLSKLPIYINYIRADGVKGKYAVNNIAFSGENMDTMSFTWTISKNATMVKGNLTFLVCIVRVDANGNELIHWNSELNKDLYVSEGLEVSEVIAALYPDILEQWYAELTAEKNSGKFDGISPKIEVEMIANGHVVTITDRDGTKQFTVLNGYSPTIEVTETTEAMLSPLAHTVTITDKDGATTFEVKDGLSPILNSLPITGGNRIMLKDRWSQSTFDVLNGAQGEPGTDGVSPTITVTDIDGGHRVTITDSTGTKSFDVTDGTNGTNGKDGTNGSHGVSPIVTITEIDGGHRVTVTDAVGTNSFDVMDGTMVYTVSTTDLTPGVSPLANNMLYFVYEEA